MSADDERVYLASLDAGNASMRWPQKQSASANRLQIKKYNSEISAIFNLDLLWRPCVLLRHMDLFNNLALAKFIRHHGREVKALSEAGLLIISAPIKGEFTEIFDRWALSRGPDDPMHWHHLSGSQQKEYDLASSQKRFGEVGSLDHFLHLDEHGLSLLDMIKRYDKVFPRSRIISLSPGALRESYTKKVQIKWNEYLENRAAVGLHKKSPTIELIETILEKCYKAKARRRQFYTALETIPAFNRAGIATANIRKMIAETKSFVLNDAFYDEFEEFQPDENCIKNMSICANRDISQVWLPDEYRQVDLEFNKNTLEPVISSAFFPLDSITISDVLHCHTDETDEAVAFRSSIIKLSRLQIRFKKKKASQREIETAVRDHLLILRECLLRIFRDQKREALIEGTVAEVFFGSDPAIATPVSSSMAALSAWTIHSAIPLVGLIFTPLFAILLRRKAVKQQWRQFEVAFGRHIEQKIIE